MKKAIAYLLSLVLCLSFLSGCGEPQIYYRSYSDHVFANASVLGQMPDYRKTFSIYQFWHEIVGDHENKNPQQNLAVKIGDLQLEGEYVGYRLGWNLSYYADEYKGDGYSFQINRETGQVVYLHFARVTEEMRTLPVIANPREETERIARKWAGYYVENLSAYTIEFQDKEEYVYTPKDELKEPFRCDIYHYLFKRYINDIPTNDYIEIGITSKGTLDTIQCGEVDAFKNVTFDMSAVEESMDKYVRDAWSKFGFTVVSYGIRSPQHYPYVALTMDKQVAVVVELIVQLKDPNGNECDAGVMMVTLVSTDPNKVIATRLNPFT